MPKTRPLYFGGKADTRMAGPDVLENAAPIPWMYRKIINQNPEPDNPQISEESVKITTPVLNIRRIPVRSPQRPTGSKNIAVASKKEVNTQLRETALSPKLFSMAGNAIFTDDIKKVPINEVIATIPIIEICFFVQFIML